MEGVSTNSLRAMAPKWSLAGDDQLLDLLQKTHQKIISKCQDVNSKLDEMALALDDASIHLQNVNNKFMALSNSQFIESRVYDDDDEDFTADATLTGETAEPSATDEISTLKASLLVLERVHETAVILDESDSDSDAEVSVVLKPKDMYSERPLPYIIGSQSWKNKWHGGLIVEDSDTDSYTSKQDGEPEQYSESESEDNARPPFEENTLSESSTSLPGSVGVPAPPAAPPLSGGARPADIAAALARRLGPTDSIVREEAEEQPAAYAHVARKLYKPDQPATSTIFADEPPPLDYEPDTQSSDEDIFAEINKHTPYTQKNTMASSVTEDLFSFAKPPEERADIFSDFAPGHAEKPAAKQKSTLFEGESEPELFGEPSKEDALPHNDAEEGEAATNTKKPVGGISLFGSNKGTESIGAAILKRNQRKSSFSDDESGSDNVKNQTDAVKKPIVVDKPKITPRHLEKDESKAKTVIDNKTVSKKEKDIFEDLFSKSENVQNKSSQNIDKQPVTNVMASVKNNTNVKEKEKTNVKDLFSDNIFDDIDDIFTSSVKIPSKESNQNQKSIFDDDDLFSDIDVAKSTNQSSKDIKTITKDNIIESDIKTTAKDKKSIFDSDDELFSETKSAAENSPARNVKSHATNNTVKDNITNNLSSIAATEIVGNTEIIKKPSETIKERNLFDDSPQVTKPDPKPQVKHKSIFDSDSDDDIFAKIKTPADTKSNKPENVFISTDINEANEKEIILEPEFKKDLLVANSMVSKEKNLIQSPALFEEDEIDDLFIAANKLKMESGEENIIEIPPGLTVSPEKEIVSEYVNKMNEIDTFPEFASTSNNESPKKITKSKTVETRSSDRNLSQDVLVGPKSLLKNAPKNNNIIESSQSISKTLINESQSKDADIIQREMNKPTEIKNIVQENEKESILPDTVNENQELAAKPNIPSADVFNDIFTEPPAFEKPAESKKSKNVNALFDDDSDDESLFFKKNDGISDEKPEIFSTNANFDIFVNEPPAIDVDFTTKTSTNNEVMENVDGLFNFVQKTELNVSQSLKTTNDENIFSPVPEREQNFNKDNESLFNTVAIEENVSQTTIRNSFDDKDLSLSVPEIDENISDNNPETIEKYIVKDKSTLSEETPKSKLLFADIEDEDIFTPETEKNKDNITPEKDVSEVLNKSENSDEELFSSLPNLPTYNQNDDQNGKTKMYVNNNIANDFDIIFKESPKNEAETKKIGKLNTKNFNINVNALMPGASPKKIPKDIDKQISDKEPKMAKSMSDETDFQAKTIGNKTESDVIYRDKLEKDLNTATSTTLIEKSDSGVLNNNVSKQRPKIQVKRRPSTRKARHEAARKSAIDFGDETDNSSSFDEPKPKIVSKVDSHPNKETEGTNRHTSESVESTPIDVPKSDPKTKIEEENADNKKTTSELGNKNVFDNAYDKIETLHKDSSKIVPSKENIEENQDFMRNLNESKKTTTKLVYILNDEDIFNTQPKSSEKEDFLVSSLKSDTADIIKNIGGIKTLGKTYNEINKDFNRETTKEGRNKEKTLETEVKSLREDKKSLFDDSEDELFHKKKNISKKTTIFDSDSEEDLFTGKKSKEKINKEQKNKEVKEKKVVVKGSLFGDDDDDDDLFGLRKTKIEAKPQQLVPSTSREASNAATIASKTVEPVFSDPLSMLENDD